MRESDKTGWDWRNISMLALVHVVALGGLALYLPVHGLSLAAAVIGLVLTAVTLFSVSAGYHRLFSHRAYRAHPLLRLFLLVFGAGAFQNTALAWAADHRRHHRRTDSDLDPYDARRGFWYAHIGWVLRKSDPEMEPTAVHDLQRDPLVAWQSRNYALLGISSGLVLPLLLGLAFGDPWGGFIVGGAVRLFLCYHATFAINSFAHLIGAQPYSDKDTSRDSLLTALISMGEGYHNFHHTFPADYRNGVGAHQFDPSKWVLRALAAVGLASDLRRTPDPAIVRARLRMDERRLVTLAVPPEAEARLQLLRAGVDRAAARWHEAVARYEASKGQATKHMRAALASVRAEVRAASRDLRLAYTSWRRALSAPDNAQLARVRAR